MAALHPYRLRERLAEDQAALTIWSSVADRGMVNAICQHDFDCVTLDMQHGGHDERSVFDGVAEVVHHDKPCIVRIPVGRFDMASRALDYGADGVIAPMINSVEDARAFADSMKYPPIGGRSWGPTRAVGLRGLKGGNDYLHSANASTVAIAMIETRQALEALDDILAVDGIDAVFVGPADFSIAWTDGALIDARYDNMMSTIEDIARRAGAAGKAAGIFAVEPADAPRFSKMGYRLIATGFDTSLVAKGAASVLAAARGSDDSSKIDGGY